MSKCFELKRELRLFIINKSICVRLKKDNHLLKFDLYENTTYFGMFFKSILLEKRSFNLKNNLRIEKLNEHDNTLRILLSRKKELAVSLINKTLKFNYRAVN